MMNGNNKSASWYGKSADEEEWCVEIEHDCFSESGPFVVTLWVESSDEENAATESLVTASPKQAREMAEALIRSADAADLANLY